MRDHHRLGLRLALVAALGAAGTVVLAWQAQSQQLDRIETDAVVAPSPYDGYRHRPGSPSAEAAEGRREALEDRQLDQRAHGIDERLLGGGICAGC
jgi:hypothetical protein